MDLYASDTESDSGSTDNEQKDGLSVEDCIRKTITDKYKACHGKQLFIRFPAKLPEDKTEFEKKVHALSPLITKAHKPRQRYARFCLVDFGTESDRNEARKQIRKSINSDPNFKGIVASVPRTESEEYLKELIEKKIQSTHAKKAKFRLKKAASNRGKGNKEYTSTIVVRNLPENVSMIEMRKLFPNAVDIQLKSKRRKDNKVSTATVTFPSSLDARKAQTQKLSMGGTQLAINFNSNKTHKKKAKKSVVSKEISIEGTKDTKKTKLKKKAKKATATSM